MNPKNGFSYLVWFLYSLSLCICLLFSAGILSARAGYSYLVGYGVVALWLVLNGLLVFLISAWVCKFPCLSKERKMTALVLESLVVVILFAAGCWLRVCGLFDANGGISYYEMAKVVGGQSVSVQAHGAVGVYLTLLHLVFSLFGNHYLAGIWLQVVLQMIAGFCFYRAVRKLVGVTASLVTLGFMMLGPLMLSSSLMLSPEMLFLAAYAAVLYLCSCCIKGKRGPVSCLLTGMAVSIVCYLDIMGISLLILLLVGLLRMDTERECPLSRRLRGMFFAVLGCCVGFALLILVQTFLSGMAFCNVLYGWWSLFTPDGFALPEMLDVSNLSVEMLCLLLSMIFGVFSFWRRNDRERQSIWICVAASVLLLQSFGMTTNELKGQLNLYILFAVLAGIGVADIFSFPEEREEEMTETETEATESKVELIENPLPLPKKHVKKTLDYDLTDSSDKDDFDFDVADDDDFDI